MTTADLFTPAAAERTTSTRAVLDEIRRALREEYAADHGHPWIVGYSGGKDSTLLLQLVFETVQESNLRDRQIHVVSNDTLVESPLVTEHLYQSLAKIREAVENATLPLTITVTTPPPLHSYWYCVIGRGYIPPTRNMRWCTDRLKIRPTNLHLKQLSQQHGGAILLIGTRKAESTDRRRRMSEREAAQDGRMNEHDSIDGVQVFAPLADLTDNEVWDILLAAPPPWTGTHRNLITLYRNAGGGECPLVLSQADAPACGTTSPRFGCWTCTVVKKDKSLQGLVDTGAEQLEPLLEFRDWLIEMRETESNRWPCRRNRPVKYRDDGTLVRGPFTIAVRKRILSALEALQQETGNDLLPTEYLPHIYAAWDEDADQDARWAQESVPATVPTTQGELIPVQLLPTGRPAAPDAV